MIRDRKVHLFLVDDNLSYATSLGRYLQHELRQMPLDVSIFGDGENCLRALQAQRPALVILDDAPHTRQERGMDGYSVLRRIKEECPDTGVIVLSASKEISQAVSLLRNGAYDYVLKSPVAFSMVRMGVTKFLRQRDDTLFRLRFRLVAGLLAGLVLGLAVIAACYELS